MTKRDMFQRLIRPKVLLALKEIYGVNVDFPSDKQLEFVDTVTEGLYETFSGQLGIKELKELLGEQNEKRLSDTL